MKVVRQKVDDLELNSWLVTVEGGEFQISETAGGLLRVQSDLALGVYPVAMNVIEIGPPG
jgi:hypothetical protein